MPELVQVQAPVRELAQVLVPALALEPAPAWEPVTALPAGCRRKRPEEPDQLLSLMLADTIPI